MPWAQDNKIRLPCLWPDWYIEPNHKFFTKTPIELMKHTTLASIATLINLGQTLRKMCHTYPISNYQIPVAHFLTQEAEHCHGLISIEMPINPFKGSSLSPAR